jgi:catechol 2,3-dioxygenase-like lactoylglutathione lyase family enzyme
VIVAHTALNALHHIGVTVSDLRRSIAFWERMLGAPGRDRRTLEGPRLGELVGYPTARVESCWFDLPGGVGLELVHYLEPAEPAYESGSAHPGNVHVCLRVKDIAAAHAHAVASGARPVSHSPIEVAEGPRAGTRVAYLTDPDGVTIELLQPPPQGAR